MENNSHTKSTILSLSILLGLSVLGFFIFKGLKTFSDKDRSVTVKGLAELNMTATSASLVLESSFSGDNLQNIINQNEVNRKSIIEYLLRNGYNKNEIKVNNVGVTDRQKHHEIQWINGQNVEVKIDRYTIRQNLSIQSKNVTAAEDLTAQIELDLISNGITVNITTNYVFPELNSIKPQLIAESTKNARIAGEQFANDSQAMLGKIKTASQGQITIAGKNYYDDEINQFSEKPKEPYIQKARVVSTIVFFLE